MDKNADDMVLRALKDRHGTIIVDNPTRAMIAVGAENSSLHEEVDRCYKELDLYRSALEVISYISPQLMGDGGSIESAFAKSQQLARAALAQIVLGSVDLALLSKVHRAQREASEKHGRD